MKSYIFIFLIMGVFYIEAQEPLPKPTSLLSGRKQCPEPYLRHRQEVVKRVWHYDPRQGKWVQKNIVGREDVTDYERSTSRLTDDADDEDIFK